MDRCWPILSACLPAQLKEPCALIRDEYGGYCRASRSAKCRIQTALFRLSPLSNLEYNDRTLMRLFTLHIRRVERQLSCEKKFDILMWNEG